MGRKRGVVGIDPSFRNFTAVRGTLTNGVLRIKSVHYFPTKKPMSDWDCAQYIWEQALPIVKEARVVYAEIPSGSRSARSARTLGIVTGLLVVLATHNPNFIKVTPRQTRAVVGEKKVTKRDAIEWAKAKHPEAPWFGVAAKDEHLADAITAIYAGEKCLCNDL